MQLVYPSLITIVLICGAQSGKPNKSQKKDNGGLFYVEPHVDELPGWPNTDDILEAVSVNDYGIPRKCSEKELTNTLKRCVFIWKSYCECKHCNDCEQGWPPSETNNWINLRQNIGWEQLDEAWKWTGKCAYNATNLWRIWCGGGEVTNENTKEKEEYVYWFLLSINSNLSPSQVQELCIQHECPGKTRSFENTKTTQISTESKESTTVTTNLARLSPNNFESMETVDIDINVGLDPDPNQDTVDALGTTHHALSEKCDNDELNEILKRCILIWQEYCRCAGCDKTCGEEEWPPQATDTWKTSGRKIGWEELDGAWKWAAKCAHNATQIWRVWCYDWIPEIDDDLTEQKEHEYWFLTELGMTSHPKIVQGLCQSYECYKFNVPPELPTTQVLISETTGTAINRNRFTTAQTIVTTDNGTTTLKLATESGRSTPTTVPKWAYIIIAVLGAIVIVFFVLCCMFLYYRKQYKKERNNREIVFDGRRGTSTTDNSTNWQHQTSFTFFGDRALPGIDESIYHTITDAPPPPSSPTFAMASFSPPSESTQPRNAVGESVTNVLYHDTTPRYVNTDDSRFSALVGSNETREQPHTYEDTGNLYSISSQTPPNANTPPYFVPTGTIAVNEYGTLGLSDERISEDKVEPGNSQKQNRGNYDHIQL